MTGAGLDLGRSRVRLAVADAGRGGPRLLRYLSAEVEAGETPVAAAAAALGAAARKLGRVRVGLGGADLMLRYLPVPQVEDWRLVRLMDFETREIASRSGAALASSYNLLPVPKELDEDDTMLLGLVREDLLEAQAAQLAPIAVESFTPNAIALYNAWLALGDHQPRTTLLAHFGAGTLDLALVRGTDLYFARSLTTPLERRDATLAQKLGVDATRARALIHKHLDLRVVVGERLGADADRVTRPVLPLYEGLPTLLSGAVTLCKAQARLRELALERVLITGGGAAARGFVEMLHDRLRVPVEVWNPAAELDDAALSAEDAERLAADGPAATVALGLALSAADSELYALEILTAGARRRRDFAERGVWSIAAGAAAAIFLGLAFWRHGAIAAESEAAAKRAKSQVGRVQAANERTEELLQRVAAAEQLGRELATRLAIGESARRFLGLAEAELPESLWLDSWSLRLENGKDWGSTVDVPVVRVAGRSGEEARIAAQQLSAFAGRLQALTGDASRVLPSAPTGKELNWSLKALLLAVPPRAEEEQP